MRFNHSPGAIGDDELEHGLARSTPTTGKAAVAFMSDSFGLSADTPHHMRPAGTMMPSDQGESIPSFETDALPAWLSRALAGAAQRERWASASGDDFDGTRSSCILLA
jgi:hypothetical protein